MRGCGGEASCQSFAAGDKSSRPLSRWTELLLKPVQGRSALLGCVQMGGGQPVLRMGRVQTGWGPGAPGVRSRAPTCPLALEEGWEGGENIRLDFPVLWARPQLLLFLGRSLDT